ncbi:MAG: deiodinase family protein [Gemmataceae bacterium]|nr:deiodinase family protein [Gemmataceae bacterium]
MKHLAAVLALAALAADKPDLPKLPADPKEALAAARFLERAYARKDQPEAVRMLIAIAKGSQMGPGEGWFGPCHTRYTFDWLAKRHGAKDKGIAAKQFKGDPALFARLDRDKDGKITADDLDWSENSAYLRQMALTHRLFARINGKRDGKATEAEWQAFFKALSKGKGHVTPEDLRAALFPPAPEMSGFMPGGGPSPEVLVRGLFAGEIGSLQEGPALDEAAPDFTLKTANGKEAVRLSSLIGPKPLVLVFGNYTCGPFRSTAVRIEELHQRYKDRATFLGVYVREAHPTDGWAMASNLFAGIAVKQPKTYAERAEVCTAFCEAIKPTMPYLVDEMNDPVGNAYSGMPGRMYVIDPKGKVAYKSGRGPFGFKVGELEQALVMSLVEFPPPPEKGLPEKKL